MSLRVLELFCGIGGCAAALDSRDAIVAAVDINQHALRVYNLNFTPPGRAATVESLSDMFKRQSFARHSGAFPIDDHGIISSRHNVR